MGKDNADKRSVSAQWALRSEPETGESATQRPDPSRLLLVDDDEQFLEVLATNLEDEGFQSLCHRDVPSAMNWLLGGGRCDLILLDWFMPEVPGLAFLKQLRDAGVETPVFVLTAVNKDIIEDEALASGAIDFIDKSRRFSVLLKRIRLILDRTRAPDSVAEPEEIALGDLDLSPKRLGGRRKTQEVALAHSSRSATRPCILPEFIIDRDTPIATVSIALIDHRTLVRKGLKQLLSGDSYQVVLEGEDLSHVSEWLRTGASNLDLVVFDFNVEASDEERRKRLEEIVALKPGVRTITLSDRMCMERLTWSVHAGVDGFLLKDISPSAFRCSLQLVMMGEKFFSTDPSSWLAKRAPVSAVSDSSPAVATKRLSNREVEVLRRLILGQPNKVIANDLDITEGTVKGHLKGILRKINVTNRTQAAVWALDNGMAALPTPGEGAGTAP
jgi:two-component system, NarL family, nitrate/nitrite response regulator NarL